MDKEKQKIKAELFLKQHFDSEILVLPNAWDVISAKIYEQEGFKAIGTTSAGIAASYGYCDGQKIPAEYMIAATRRIATSTSLPITADIEAGYSHDIDEIVRLVHKVLGCGVVGINIEDSTGNEKSPLYDLAHQCEKIKAIREMANCYGTDLVINARTDVYMISSESKEKRIGKAIKRGNAYKEAGADLIFVPDLEDLTVDDLKLLSKEIDAPLNIIAGGHTPSLRELESIDIARVSLGPRHMRIMLYRLKEMSKEILGEGSFKHLESNSLSYDEVNEMF